MLALHANFAREWGGFRIPSTTVNSSSKQIKDNVSSCTVDMNIVFCSVFRTGPDIKSDRHLGHDWTGQP